MLATSEKMLHLKLGLPSFAWQTYGKTLEIIDHLMLQGYKGYDTIIVNEAHKYPNIEVFAKLCQKENVLLLVGGLLNEHTEKLIQLADKIEKF